MPIRPSASTTGKVWILGRCSMKERREWTLLGCRLNLSNRKREVKTGSSRERLEGGRGIYILYMMHVGYKSRVAPV